MPSDNLVARLAEIIKPGSESLSVPDGTFSIQLSKSKAWVESLIGSKDSPAAREALIQFVIGMINRLGNPRSETSGPWDFDPKKQKVEIQKILIYDMPQQDGKSYTEIQATFTVV